MIPFVTPPEVVNIRARIAELQADLISQERVPLNDTEAGKRADAMVQMHAARVPVKLILGHLIHDAGAPVVAWSIDHNGAAIEPGAFDLACALNPERMRADLRALIAASSHSRGPTPAERAKRVRKLRDELLTAEREEEALISNLLERGVNVHRRPDCDPSLVLNLE